MHTRIWRQREGSRPQQQTIAIREYGELKPAQSPHPDPLEFSCAAIPEHVRRDRNAAKKNAGILPPPGCWRIPGKLPNAVQTPRLAWRPARHRDNRAAPFAYNHSSREASCGEECVSARCSRWRPRARADITVPMGMAVIVAISL